MLSYGWLIYDDTIAQPGWVVDVLDTTKTAYGAILSEINNEVVISPTYTFNECTSLVVAPQIPTTVQNLMGTFYKCTSLTTVEAFPSNVTQMSEMCRGVLVLKL